MFGVIFRIKVRFLTLVYKAWPCPPRRHDLLSFPFYQMCRSHLPSPSLGAVNVLFPCSDCSPFCSLKPGFFSPSGSQLSITCLKKFSSSPPCFNLTPAFYITTMISFHSTPSISFIHFQNSVMIHLTYLLLIVHPSIQTKSSLIARILSTLFLFIDLEPNTVSIT